MKEEQRVIKKVYTIDSGSLFSSYIPRLESLTDIQSVLNLLKYYQIFHSLDPKLYHTNCFVYVLEQYRVPSDKIKVIRSYLVDIYVKI